MRVSCDNIYQRANALPSSFVDAKIAPGSHEVKVQLLESNDIGWKNGWSGYVLDMPHVPVAVEVNISSNAGLTNLEVVMRRCSSVKKLEGTATAELSIHALLDLDAAIEPHRGELHTIEALHVPKRVARLLVRANITNFDWDCETPTHLDIYFSVPRTVHFVRIWAKPDDSKAWEAFTKNALGLTKFKVPFDTTVADLTFLLDHNIQTLDVSSSDAGCDLLRNAPKQWKERIVRLGIQCTQGVTIARMMQDFPHLIHIVYDTVDDDHPDGGDLNLLPELLQSLCRQRNIKLIDEHSEHCLWDFYDSGPEH